MDAKSHSIASALSHLAASGAGAAQIAAVAAEKMHGIHLALAPIIGERGVSVLYWRCLFLTSQDAAWTAPSCREDGAANRYAMLQAAIAQQTAEDALRISEVLFRTLYAVLVSLIGTALTERLLHPMFDTSPNGQAVQEAPHE